MNPLVSILIVNYNGLRYLGRCLDSLLNQSFPRHRFEVVLVDNGSTDGSIPFIQKHYPWVVFILAGKNLGFSEGNNLAHRHASGQVCILLNSDAIADPHWLEELVNEWHRQPNVILGSKLVLDSDVNSMNSAGLCLLRDGRGADAGFGEKDHGQWEDAKPIFGACGAAMVLPSKPGKDLLSKHFFMYSEDLDAAWGHRLNGGQVALVPRSLVRHVVGASGRPGNRYLESLKERNRVLVSVRNGDIFLAFAAIITLYLKFILAFLQPKTWPRIRPRFLAFVGVLWCLPQEIFVRYERRNSCVSS